MYRRSFIITFILFPFIKTAFANFCNKSKKEKIIVKDGWIIVEKHG